MISRPNILIFMTDHEQAQVIAPGHPCRTPFVEKLAAEGLRFGRFYTPAAHCCPSRATMFTGLYPSRHGIFNNVLNGQAIHTSLYPGVRTFGQDLKEAGYSLAFSGKWHVCADETPADHGWQELKVTAAGGERHEISWQRWQAWQAMARQPKPEDGTRGPGEIIRPGWGPYSLYGSRTGSNEGPAYTQHRDWDTVARGIAGLGELSRGDAPWCLYIGVGGPHDPYVIPEHYARMYDPAEVPLPPNFHDSLEDKPRIYQRQRRQVWGQLSEEEYRQAIAHYWGYCTMLDDMFGEVLSALDDTGCAHSTLVMFLSDHGDYAGAHGLFAKGVAAFDEAYHIPLAIRWPAGIANPGRVVDEFATLADVAPTLLELAGCSVPEDLTGRSLLPFLRNQPVGDWPDAFYSQMNGVELYYTQRVVQTKRHKYVYNGFDFDELYDLEADPYELVNLSARSDMEPIKRDLVKRMWRFAYRERDTVHNGYITVGLAPYGPQLAFEEEA